MKRGEGGLYTYARAKYIVLSGLLSLIVTPILCFLWVPCYTTSPVVAASPYRHASGIGKLEGQLRYSYRSVKGRL